MVSRSFTRSKSHAYACYQDLRTVRVQPCNHTLGMMSETGSIRFDTDDHGYHERRITFGTAFLAFGTRGESKRASHRPRPRYQDFGSRLEGYGDAWEFV